MDKLSPEHLPQLLDEPIYVLNEHFTTEKATAEEEKETASVAPDFKGQNKKGILIINEDNTHSPISPEDEIFIFKGLNELGITLEDVAIIGAGDAENTAVAYSKKIVFQQNPSAGQLYQVISTANIQQLTCHTISEIRQNQDLKVQFWLGLKAMFPQES